MQTTTNRASWSRVSWVRSTTPNRTWTWCSAAESPACRRVPHLRHRRRRHCPPLVWCNTTIRQHRRIPPRHLQPFPQHRPSHTITPPPLLPLWSANNSHPGDQFHPRPAEDSWLPLPPRRPLRNRPSRRTPWLGPRHLGAAAAPLPLLTFNHPPTHQGTYRDCSTVLFNIHRSVLELEKNKKGIQ